MEDNGGGGVKRLMRKTSKAMAVTQCADSFVVVVRCSSSPCVGMWVASAQRVKNAGHSRTAHPYNIIFFTNGPCDFCIREETVCYASRAIDYPREET